MKKTCSLIQTLVGTNLVLQKIELGGLKLEELEICGVCPNNLFDSPALRRLVELNENLSPTTSGGPYTPLREKEHS